MTEDLIDTVTIETLRDALQDRGFRATIETDAAGARFIRSATAGLAFEARLGNPAGADAALDVRLVAAIEIQGNLDPEIVNRWNNSRRFCRLHREGDMLLLDMDISVAGGVAPAWLARQVDMWDRLVEALIEHLKRELAAVAPRADAAVA